MGSVNVLSVTEAVRGSAPIPALIGVSGGRDSVALLHALVAAGRGELLVCHLDHRLRASSTDDSTFVAELARELGLECIVHREDIAARAKLERRSIETAARDARYQFFARVAAERQRSRLYLAHHADDQVETFLFRLFRGSGATGLGGMRAQASRQVDGTELMILRPLLGVWREEIDAYIAEHQLTFREDPSNADLHHARNQLRHEVIPGLERTFGREIRRSVWRAAEILREEEELLADLPPLQKVEAVLDVPTLRALPVALQRRVLVKWLREQGVSEIGYEAVEAVRALIDGPRAKANLAGGWHARRRARKLFIERPAPRPDCD
jgi:tRNA(Ile)-lysidine synthase